MASLLNKTPHELALELKDMDKEKRYQNLKEFYIKFDSILTDSLNRIKILEKIRHISKVYTQTFQ